ncbi:alpha-L-rhamnosidase [Mangrovibacterium lignilyticum]|uniref:alpha-L-rhamnosidase n=1 Tax=Mangrovibacterium lignilyticum TaxID=2668052 RepID=UPI0013CF88B8|nr:alpha-L-rhamnosidase [Mangrovibacterium lignilyticum]
MRTLKLFVLLLLTQCTLINQDVKITNLKVEYTETPLGIDVEIPSFSWQMESPDHKRDCKQIAYQLLVTDETGQTVWDSNKTVSDESLNIKYQGTPLSPTTRYSWKLSVWDNENKKHTAKSWFETGLMNPGPMLSAWSGAKWIGGSDDDIVLYAHYLPVFRINYSLQLNEKSQSTKAGFIYGANDERLMDKNKNLYHLANQKDECYVKFEIEISSLNSNKNAKLNIYRVGYHPDDKKDVPFRTFSISSAIINSENKYQKHRVTIDSNLGFTRIYLDGVDEKNRIAEVNLNPLGQGGDFIAFPVVGDIGFSISVGQIASFSDVEIRNFRSPSNILFLEKLDEQPYSGIFSGSPQLIVENNNYKISSEASETQIMADPSRNSVPMLRTTFSASSSNISKARLYATARGIYEMYLNGNRISENYFDPGLTQYNKTQLYQTYDVTDLLQPGENGLGAVLSEGWWSGGITYMGEFWNFFGDRQSLLAKLVITYKDGHEDVVVSSPETWSYYNNGPVVYGSLYQGEVYDASKDSLVEGWTTPSYDASLWKSASEINLSNQLTRDGINPHYNMPLVDDFSEQKLIGQIGNSVQKVRELTATSVDEVRPGVFVYDMGQNMVGVPAIELTDIKPGTKISLRYAEVKYPDLPEYKENVGMIMLENIRAAMAQDIYIAKGGNESIHPRFTSHGYRFIEITGIDNALPLVAVKGTVLSSVHQLASHYETSNPLVNKLWENITWSTFGNFLSIPTDCPQRNERLGWSGDISVFSRSATYLANIPQFLRRHMRAMRDVQRQDGRFTDVAPLGGGFGGVMWGSAGITVAWENYQQYGDQDLLAEHYQAMKNYINYLKNEIDPISGILQDKDRWQWSSLGDWLSPEYDKSEKTLLWESYFIYDLEIMQQVAAILDKKEDTDSFMQLCADRKAFFNQTYVDETTGKTVSHGKLVDTQTSYVLPLVFDIFNEKNKEKAIESFVETVKKENIADNGNVCSPYSLMTGFIGTAWISEALSKTRNSDAAYRLLQQTSYPSWLYPVTQGATTIWERLNSYTHVDGFGGNNRMNSFNHYSFGAVAAWMYNYSLGIARDESHPGFKHFILQPEPDSTGEMTYAKGHYDSMYGRIESSWEQKEDGHHYRFVVPANTSATVYISVNRNETVETKTKISRKEDGKVVYEIGSGEYYFFQNRSN